mmetsp:Transcript_8941/g.13432  ORF Transcript_8941/g.13432 Transcript_8941/m.13432 type:complete len:1031 (-) Transcript_8941:98-3190(-)
MGNEITKKYELPAEHNATAGLCQLWKIYPGYKMAKDMTKREVSVWIMTKDGLSKRDPIPVTEKSHVEQVFQIMKKDVLTMKDMSHGGIVKVIEVVEEGRKGIAFVTERIVCSLADLLQRFESIPGRYSWHSVYLDPSATITEVEISRGILNIASGLQYLHSVKRRLHLNISPESIVLTPNGQWKLCGLGFSLSMTADDVRVALPYFLNQSNAPIRLEPDVRYCAPEVTEGGLSPGGNIRYASIPTDIFALGLLGFEVYRYNLQTAMQGRTHIPVLDVNNNSISEHCSKVLDAIAKLDYSSVPLALRQVVTGMLQASAAARVSALDIINNPFFHSGDLAVLKAMDELPSKDVGSQASNLASLPSQISHFSPRLIENSILPVVCLIGTANPAMWSYTLPVLAFISSKIPSQSFLRVATPAITKGLAVSDFTETIYAFVKHVDLLLDNFDMQYFQQNVVPMLCNGVDRQSSPSLQVSAIKVLVDDRVQKHIDQDTFLTEIVPRVCKEACKNADVDVKLRALYLLSVTASRFDRNFVTKNIFPSLKHILEKAPPPQVSMACVGVYSAMQPLVNSDSLCTAVLPVLVPILADRTLNREQFELLTNRILFFQQLVLTDRTNEYSIPEIRVWNNQKPKGYFFKEDADKAKGINSGMITPQAPPPPPPAPHSSSNSTAPPPVPSKPPPAVPSSAPPSVPNKPPSVPSKPPSVPSSAPSSSPPPVPQKPPSIPATAAPSVPPKLPAAPPVPEAATSGSSLASFFSSSSSAATTQSTAAYTPPSVPSPAPATANDPNDIDIDDFMSSFKKSSNTSTSATTTSGSSNPPPFTPTIPPPKRASYSDKPQQQPVQQSGGWGAGGMDMFGDMTLSQHSNSSAGSSSGMGGNSMPAGGGFNTGNMGGSASDSASIEEQIRRTQAEIARLSGQQQGSGYGQQGNMQYNSQPNYNQQQYGGYGQQQQQMDFFGMGSPSYPQQQPQQQQFGSQGMGYNPPQQQQYSHQAYGGQSGQSGGGGGYQPPSIPQQQQQSSNNNDPFGFLDFK